jgi:hypothetical protein
MSERSSRARCSSSIAAVLRERSAVPQRTKPRVRDPGPVADVREEGFEPGATHARHGCISQFEREMSSR